MKTHHIKLWILAYISFRFFLGGVEEFLLLPTAWYYIHSLGGSIGFLGAVAAAYAIGATLFSPAVGRLTRKLEHVYMVMVATSLVKVSASVVYSIPISKFFPLFGRFVSGVADSCDGVIYGKIANYISEHERAKYATIFDGVFTLGTAFGAIACSSLTFNGHFFGWSRWSINIGNAPGVFLAVIWLIFFTLTLYLPCTFGVDIAPKKKEEISMFPDSQDSDIEEGQDFVDDVLEYDREQAGSISQKFIESRIACLLYLVFSTMFFASVASFYPSLLAIQLFHLKVIHVKLLFVNGTLSLLLLFLSLYISAQKFQERSLLAFILTLQLPPLIILLLLATLWNDVSTDSYYLLLIYVCLGLPFFGFNLCGSLLRRITSENKFASTYQRLYIILVQLAIISSRLISGFAFSQTALTAFSVGMIFMWLVGIIWFGLVYRQLTPRNITYF